MKFQRAVCTIAALLCALATARAAAPDATQPKPDPTSWTGGSDPKTVGEAIALNLTKRPFANRAMPYPDVCTAYGSLRLAVAVKDQDLIDKLIGKYSIILKPEGKRYVPNPTNVDLSVFGILPFELYRQTKDDQYLTLAKHSADAQWAKPDAQGLTSQTRFWLDDMFMIIALQTEAYRVVKDPVYLDRASHEMVAYIDKLQLPNGLFYHSNGPGLFCWGRANGWMAAGFSELLSQLPADHPDRAKILASYKKFMAALLTVQAPDGMWRQLLDNPNAWEESSCTGMFTFAMARGIKNGWLDAATYNEPTKKSWNTLCTNFLDADANVKEVCIGTGRGTNEDFYLKRPRALGDLHGQAAVVWAAWAMLDLAEK